MLAFVKFLCQAEISMEGAKLAKDTLIVAAMILALSMSSAHAYIDPGSGSVLTTAIIGFFAAIAYTCRKYFYRLKDKLAGRKPTDTRR